MSDGDKAGLLVVVSYYNARPDNNLRDLLASMESSEAGVDFNVCLVVNQEPGVQKGIGPRLQQLLGAWLHGEKPGSWTDSLLIGLGKLLYRLGLVRYSRDLTAVHQLLYEKQLAVPLGENFISEGRVPPDELQHVVPRIRRLLQSG